MYYSPMVPRIASQTTRTALVLLVFLALSGTQPRALSSNYGCRHATLYNAHADKVGN